MIKLVLADMDNTLKLVEEPLISKRTIEAAKRLMGIGVAFGPCTGRDYDKCVEFFRGEKDCVRDAVLSSGKRVLAGGCQVSQTFISRDAMAKSADFLRDRCGGYVLSLPTEEEGSTDFAGYWCTEEQAAWATAASGERVVCYDHVPDADVLTGVAIIHTKTLEEADKIRAELMELVPEIELVSPIPFVYDILPRGVNKATGIKRLVDELGISLEEVIYFGDSENDLHAMGVVPNSVAVSNATPEAKAAARWHVGACGEDGVAIALEQIADAVEGGAAPAFMCGD